MVEICVAVADVDSAHGLMQGLARLFDRASVSFDSKRSEVRVRSEWESRAVVHVIDAVESWLAADDIGSAKLSIGDRSVTLFGPGRSAPPQRDLSEQAEGHAMKNACVATPASETDDQVRALATISALMRSAQGGNDSVTMLGRACESIGRALGFERTGIVRLSDDDRADAIAAHDWPLRELTEFAASAEVHAIFGLARQTGDVLLLTQAFTLARGSRAVVVVPLIAAGRCHGFLLAARGDTAFDLDPTSRLLLATLGDILSVLFERAIAYDELVSRNRLETDFIALASHEIRSPAAAVCGIATTLHTQGDLLCADERRGLSRVLYEQGQRLHRLVDQLLDLSRLDASSIRIDPTTLAIRERTDEIVRDVAGDRAGEIEIRIDPALLMQADANAFDHIVSNLVANALRYGRKSIAVSASVQDRHFRLAVEDRGPGVPRELEPALFDRFTRGDNGGESGTGLGLSIARAYAHAHGGELVYGSAKPHGARFELVIPISSERGVVGPQHGLDSAHPVTR